MALARRVKSASARARNVEQDEAIPSETGGAESHGDAQESQAPNAAGDGSGETQRGALLILGLGGTFVMMGLALILGRELGYTGRVELLSKIGLTPGGFVFTGLVLCASSLVLRSFTALSHRLEDLELGQNTRIKRAIRAAAGGAISDEAMQIWKDVEENVRGLMTCREGEREESTRNANFIRDAEIKIDTIKRTLEETHRRVLEVHHQVGEGLGETSVAELGPQLRESLERALHERSTSWSQELRAQSEKAIARTQEKIDAFAATIEKHVEKGSKSDHAALESLKKELERTRAELAKSIEKLADKGSEAPPQVAELKQDLREVLRRCDQIERELKSAPRFAAPAAPAPSSTSAAPSMPAPAPAMAAAHASAAPAQAAPASAAASAAPASAAPASSGAEPTAAVASAIARLRQMKP